MVNRILVNGLLVKGKYNKFQFIKHLINNHS